MNMFRASRKGVPIMVHKGFLPASLGVLTVLMFGLLSAAQTAPQTTQQPVSVADAARKAREEKKGQKPAAKVFTDDDIANLKGSVSVVGPAPVPPPDAADKPADGSTPPATPAKATPTPAVKDEAYWRAAFAEARKKLADDSKELDVLQREYSLKQQQYYSDPNVALRQQYSNQDLIDTQAQIDKKKADVDQDNQAISTLEDDLRKAGGDPGWATEPQT
jgi:hypothetical protein